MLRTFFVFGNYNRKMFKKCFRNDAQKIWNVESLWMSCCWVDSIENTNNTDAAHQYKNNAKIILQLSFLLLFCTSFRTYMLVKSTICSAQLSLRLLKKKPHMKTFNCSQWRIKLIHFDIWHMPNTHTHTHKLQFMNGMTKRRQTNSYFILWSKETTNLIDRITTILNSV